MNNRVQIYPAALFIFTGLVYYLIRTGPARLVQRCSGAAVQAGDVVR
ncbi:hypothetical protein RJ498_002189 [Pluralibacter gergoviae]